MKYFVNAKVRRSGNGKENFPFKTISEAAKLAKAGDEVLVFPGVYREYVDPANAGTEDKPIVYRSVEPRKAVITGAEIVNNWKKYDGDVWVSIIGNGIFNDYNPYTTKVFGDWYFADNAHTGISLLPYILGIQSKKKAAPLFMLISTVLILMPSAWK